MITSQNFEQSMNLFRSIKIGCAVAAFIFLLAAIALFFLLKIPNVFGELTGRGARKAIKAMTAENGGGSADISRKIGEDGRHRRRAHAASSVTTKLRETTCRPHGDLSGKPQVTVKMAERPAPGVFFEIERRIVEIHTDEVI